ASGRAPGAGRAENLWLLRRNHGDPFAHALNRWRATRSQPWLVATLESAPAGASAMDSLLVYADAIHRDAPAWPVLAWLRARRMLVEGRLDAARKLTD